MPSLEDNTMMIYGTEVKYRFKGGAGQVYTARFWQDDPQKLVDWMRQHGHIDERYGWVVDQESKVDYFVCIPISKKD